MQSNSFIPSQRSSPQRGQRRMRTAPSQLQLLRKPSLVAKIEVLDAFQYRSRKTPSDTIAVLNLLETKQNCGMHVSELWSTKQHQHFLRSLQAFEAQKVREQMERERLFNARVKQIPGHTLDVLYERLTHSDHPAEAVKTYALGRPGFVRQEIAAGLKAAGQFRRLRVSKCKGGSRPGTPRMQTINSLIKQCDDLVLIGRCQRLQHLHRSHRSL